MKTKLLLTLVFLLLAAPAAFAQAAAGGPTKVKVAMVDMFAFRSEVSELKAKYEKLQAEFAPKQRDLESMQNSIASKQKVLQENKALTLQQAQKLNEEIQQLDKEFKRSVQDSQEAANRREKAETGDIYDKIYKFLEQYCARHGITYVFDANRLQETGVVVFLPQSANITRDFISEYNKANPVQTPAK